ncbi:MAG: Ig-like domain-containing protein [Bryobacteraceae bacterium]
MSRSRMIVIAAMLVALSGARVAAAQTVASLKIIAGDGQVACYAEQCTLKSFQPLTVQALDSGGHAVPNATITWTVTSGQQTTVASASTTTDANGMSSNVMNQSVPEAFGSATQPYLPSTVVAAANNGSPSAIFSETFALDDLNALSMVFASSPTTNGQLLLSPLPAVSSGSTLPNIQIYVGGDGIASAGVQGVSIELLLAPGQTSPTIKCAPSNSSSPAGNPGTVITGAYIVGSNPDANATCTPLVSGSGTGQFYVMVGGVSAPTSNTGGGTVTTTGTDVAWVSGSDFSALVQNQEIRINGVEYVIASVNSQTDLTLASSAGNQNGVVWLPFQPMFLQLFGPYTFTSVPGNPAAINLLQGNNQVLSPGQSLGTLVAQVVDSHGNPVQGVNVSWSANPNASVALSQPTNPTDNNGQVSDAASFSGAAAGNVGITVALSNNSSINATFIETALVPIKSLQKISGDGQSAVASTNFALPLVVQVNGFNNPLANYPVQFSISGPAGGPALLSANSAVTNGSGQAQVTVAAGNAIGTVTVTASVSGFSQTFTLTVLPTGPTPTGIAIVSGSGQSAVINTNFPAPLVVQLTSGTIAVSNYTVQFSASGPVSVSSNSSLTNSAGQASVTVTAGSVTGPASVTASVPGYSVTFGLTVTPPGPTLTASSFANAASGQVNFISPCGLATITAAGLDPSGAAGLFPQPVFGPLPTSANGISIDFNNTFAPIFSATLVNGQPQLLVQVPCEVQPGNSVPVTVNVGAGSASVNVPVLAVAPGIFQIPYSDGALRAVALRSDGSFVSLSNPGRRGETVRVYVTGLGPTVPFVGTGQVDNPGADLIGADARATGTVIVGISGSGGVTVTSARIGANMIGVFEVAFLVPLNAPQGNNIAFSVGVVPAGSATAVNSVTSTIPIQ